MVWMCIRRRLHTFTITVNAVNDPPTFTPGGDLTGATAILEDAGPQSFAGWATNMKPGPDTATDESGQTWTFEVIVTNTTTYMAFTTPPSVSPAGVLAFQTAPDANGTATVTVQMIDSGGARSLLTHTLTITATAVNDVPSFTPGPLDESVPEDIGQVQRTAVGEEHHVRPGHRHG